MRYVIEAIPPSNNRFMGRKNIWEYRAEKEKWDMLVLYRCIPRPQKPL